MKPINFSIAALNLLATAAIGAFAAFGPIGAASAQAQQTSAAAQLERFESVALTKGDALRGQHFFGATPVNELSCASCHGLPPTLQGKHASTGKAIDPLAPSVNASRFTDQAKVDKWFKRNCKDVMARECTAAEKADVIAYLLSLKR